MPETQSNHTVKTIVRNSLYGLSTWILPLVLSFVGTPIIIKGLGEKDYGLYALVLGFMGYSFNLNFGRAITKYIAEYRVSGETEKIRDVISAAFFINLIVSSGGVIIIFAGSGWLVSNFFQIELQDQSKTIAALYLSALVVFFYMINQIFNSILQGIHRFDVYSNIFNVNSVLMMVGNIILILNGYNMLGLLVWNVVLTFVTAIVVFFAAKKLLPEFGIDFRINYKVYKLVINYTSSLVAYQLLANALVLFERSWITRKLGPINLTYYVVPMLLALYIHAFIGSILIVLFPLASELTNDREKLLRLYIKASKIVCIIAAFMVLSFITAGREFLTLWMSAEFAEKSYILLCFHAVTFGLLAVHTVSWQTVEGLGHTRYNLLLVLINVIINITLIITLIDNYGNVGAAVGRMAAFGVIFLSVFYVEKWVFGKIQIKFWTKTAAVLVISIVCGAYIENLVLSKLTLSWLTLVLATFAGGILYCLLIWLSGLITVDEQALIKNLFRKQNA